MKSTDALTNRGIHTPLPKTERRPVLGPPTIMRRTFRGGIADAGAVEPIRPPRPADWPAAAGRVDQDRGCVPAHRPAPGPDLWPAQKTWLERGLWLGRWLGRCLGRH